MNIPGLPPEQLAMLQAMMSGQLPPVMPPAAGPAAYPGSAAMAAASTSGGMIRPPLLGGGLPAFQLPARPPAAAGWLQGAPAGQPSPQAGKRSAAAAAAGNTTDTPKQKKQRKEGAAPASSSPARTPAALASGPAINANPKKDEDTLLMARALVPSAGPWVSLPGDALQHLQQHIYCSLAGSNMEQLHWGLNVVNLLTGTARSEFVQEGWAQVVGALLQLVKAGLDAAETLLVPATSGQQLMQELLPRPLWSAEQEEQQQAGRQVPVQVLDALGVAPQQPGYWDPSILAPSCTCTHAVTCEAAAAHAVANLSYLLTEDAAWSSSSYSDSLPSRAGYRARAGDAGTGMKQQASRDGLSSQYSSSSSDVMGCLGSEEVGALLVRSCKAVEVGRHLECPAAAECCWDLLRVAANAAPQLAAALASPAALPTRKAGEAPAAMGAAAVPAPQVKAEPGTEEPPPTAPAVATAAAAAAGGLSKLQVLMQHLAALAGGQLGMGCPLQLQTAAATTLGALVCTAGGRAALAPGGPTQEEQVGPDPPPEQQQVHLLPMLLASVEACMTTDAEDAAAAVREELEGGLSFKGLAVDPEQPLGQGQLALLRLWRQAAAVAAGAHLLHRLLVTSDAALSVLVTQRPWLVRTLAATAVEQWPTADSCGLPAEAVAAAIARRPLAHPAVAALGTAHPATLHIQEQLLAAVHWSQAVLRRLAASAEARPLVVGQCDRLRGYVTEGQSEPGGGKTAPVIQLLLQLEQW